MVQLQERQPLFQNSQQGSSYELYVGFRSSEKGTLATQKRTIESYKLWDLHTLVEHHWQMAVVQTQDLF